DDEARNDSLLEMTLEMAVPAGVKFVLLNTDEAVSYLKNNNKDKERIFIVVKSPRVPLKLLANNVTIPSINVGGMYYAKEKTKVSKTVYLSADDVNIFMQLKDYGIEAEVRTNPSDKQINLYKLI